MLFHPNKIWRVYVETLHSLKLFWKFYSFFIDLFEVQNHSIKTHACKVINEEKNVWINHLNGAREASLNNFFHPFKFFFVIYPFLCCVRWCAYESDGKDILKFNNWMILHMAQFLPMTKMELKWVNSRYSTKNKIEISIWNNLLMSIDYIQ